MSFSLTMQRYCIFHCVCVPGDFFILSVSDPTGSLSKNSSHIQFDDAKIRTLLLCLRAGRTFIFPQFFRPAVSQRTSVIQFDSAKIRAFVMLSVAGGLLFPFVRRAWLAPLQHPCHSFDATKIVLLCEPLSGHLILQRSRRDFIIYVRTHTRIHTLYNKRSCARA